MQHYQSILVAVDFCEHCEQTLSRGLQLAKFYGASINVVHVVDLPSHPVLEEVAVLGLPSVLGSDLTVKMVEKSEPFKLARSRLNTLLIDAGLEPSVGTLLVGSPSIELLNHATEIKAELIVMGRRKVRGLQHLLGSTTDSVLHQATCDVLAINLERVG